MRIATDRLVLREFVTDDWPAVLAYQRAPRYLRLYPWTDRSEAEVRDFVQRFVDEQEDRPRRRFQFAITFPHDGQLIGNCGIRRKPDNDWGADIGFELAPEHWGRGYATEAALAMVDFGFRELEMHHVSCRCIADNAASARVLEKWGCDPKADYARMSTSRGAGGIRCSTGYLKVSGELLPRTVDLAVPRAGTFLSSSTEPYFLPLATRMQRDVSGRDMVFDSFPE